MVNNTKRPFNQGNFNFYELALLLHLKKQIKTNQGRMSMTPPKN